jgi:RNA polymerase sigma-70 factor (ECF subfamily)
MRHTVSTNTEADEVLIQKVAGGDRLAMATLFDRHRPKVLAFIRRMVGNEALAEDLTADVFLSVWRSAAAFKGRSAVLTWVLAIARFKAISALRRPGEAELDETQALQLADGAANPEQALARKRVGELVRTCLAKLSTDHREVLDLVYYHEKSADEVARMIKIPVNTVKTRVFYARKRLAQQLKVAGVEPEPAY